MDTTDPFGDTPADWVPLSEVMPTLHQCFGVNFSKCSRHLTSAIRKGRLRHRVSGMRFNEFYAQPQTCFGEMREFEV